MRCVFLLVCVPLVITAPMRPESADQTAKLHQRKAQLLRRQGNYRASVEELRAALKLAPDDRNLQHELATSLFLTQDYKGILPELQQFLKAEPESANLNFFVGDSLFETQRIEEAVPYLKTAVKLDPKLLPADVALGLSYVRLGDPRQAIPYLKIGLILDKGGSLYYELARAYRTTGQPKLAEEMLEKYRQIQKANATSAQAP